MSPYWILITFVVVTVCSRLNDFGPFNYDPVADPRAVVMVQNARFTVLTPRVIRMESDLTQKFNDQATWSVVNRRLPVPKFSQQIVNDTLIITTEQIELRYNVGKPFASNTLTVKSTGSKPSAFTSWSYGQSNPGNLLGTIKSLDNVGVISLNCTEIAGRKENGELLHCEWALVSRDGWALVNDTQVPILDNDGYVTREVSTSKDDLYIFAHGHDFRGALQDYTLIGGKIAMVPRAAYGIWWTRWFDINDIDSYKIVDDYSSRSIPLDIFVYDMDWHSKYDWGGYSWDEHLFPFPQDTLAYLKSRGLHIAANLHDADGVKTYNSMYSKLAQYLSWPSGKDIPFMVTNKTYMRAVDDIVLQAIESQGMDFWWIDYQQGGTTGGTKGGKDNPTIITDHVRCTDKIRRGENTRAMVLARWGGLGTHRYQVGFSGDVDSLSWANLAFQPYFSSTGTNVGYGFWSHDIEGPPTDLEMYTRWIQWGSVSAIMRSHDRGMSAGDCADINDCSIVQPWAVPTDYFEANRAALQARARLIPYTYTAARQAFDSGLSLIRPMYYDYPEYNEAYTAADPQGKMAQYMYGDDILIAPVVSPAGTDQMATKTIWIPSGSWVEEHTGFVITGPKTITRKFALEEIPKYVKAGAIITEIPVVEGDVVGLASRQYSTLVFNIYPGASQGTTYVYIDDGQTLDYLNGKYSWLQFSYSRNNDNFQASISISGAIIPTSIRFIVKILGSYPPKSAVFQGVNCQYQRFGNNDNTWTYDGQKVTTIISSGVLSLSSPVTLSVSLLGSDASVLNGLKGGFHRANLAKRNLDIVRHTPGESVVKPARLAVLSSAGSALSYLAGRDLSQFVSSASQFSSNFTSAQQEVHSITGVTAHRLAYSTALLDSFPIQ